MQQNHQQNELISKQRKEDYLSYGFAVLSCFAWVSGYVYCNENNISPVQLTLMRGSVLTIVSFVLCKYKKLKIDFKQENQSKLLIRNSCFIVQNTILAFCQFYIPLYAVHTLNSTGALFVLVLDYIFDGKKISKQKSIGLAVTLVGAILIVNREFINEFFHGQSQQNKSQFQNYQSTNPIVTTAASIILLSTMVIWSFGVRYSKDLKSTPEQLSISFGSFLIILSSIAYFYISQRHSPKIIYPGFVLTGFVLTIAQFCFLQAIKLSHHLGITMVFGNFTILVAYGYSVFRYSEEISLVALIASFLTVYGMAKTMLN